mmetsp:Transcript_16754/g.38528  ORF Transcript_16754/g.38528 Transcript_16754/m.38528 type:complete len:258 (+) Transcript_16754:1159-1932(+)
MAGSHLYVTLSSELSDGVSTRSTNAGLHRRGCVRVALASFGGGSIFCGPSRHIGNGCRDTFVSCHFGSDLAVGGCRDHSARMGHLGHFGCPGFRLAQTADVALRASRQVIQQNTSGSYQHYSWVRLVRRMFRELSFTLPYRCLEVIATAKYVVINFWSRIFLFDFIFTTDGCCHSETHHLLSDRTLCQNHNNRCSTRTEVWEAKFRLWHRSPRQKSECPEDPPARTLDPGLCPSDRSCASTAPRVWCRLPAQKEWCQ